MRSFKHWSSQYIVNRAVLRLYQKRYPDHPWLTPTAILILQSWLRDSDVGLEFGSGRSTLWLAKRIRHLTSVEEDVLWHEKIQRGIRDNQIKNVELILRPQDTSNTEGFASQYVRIIDRFPEKSLAFVLVDGIYRDFCAYEVVSRIQPGGMLIIDDAQRYLPSNSYSPAARTWTQGADGKVWAQFQELTFAWRAIWTSSGVTDTVLFFKPC